jgi:hypothetical protein
MMSNIVKFGNANLPAATDLAAALRRNTEAVAGVDGQVILKMDKTGHWVYGADQTEVDREGLWAVNPFSFTHGYIAWGEGEVLSEKMVPITEPLPELEPAPPQAKRGWESQVGMSVKCVHGEDKGVEARYTVTSVGGKKAMHSLAMDVAEQIEMDQAHPVAVVKLGSDHYQHKAYGRVYTPVFDVQKWIGLDGEGAAEEGEAAQAEPVRRRRG